MTVDADSLRQFKFTYMNKNTVRHSFWGGTLFYQSQ